MFRAKALRLELTPDEGPSLETSKFYYIFQVVASLPTKACSFDWHYTTLAKTVYCYTLFQQD